MHRFAVAIVAVTILAGCGTTQPHTKTATITQTITSSPPTATRYSGHGNKTIGTIGLAHDTTITWACPGNCPAFVITNSTHDAYIINIAVTGRHYGTINVPAGIYHDVEVIAFGRWAFQIAPGNE